MGAADEAHASNASHPAATPQQLDPPSIIAPSRSSSTTSTPYDETWYTWARFFSILTNQATQDEMKQYFHMRGLRYEEADCARCEKRRDWLFKYSPVIRFMQESIAKLGGDINSDNVICRRCDTLSPRGAQAGGWGKQGILLCANHLRNKGHQEDVMAHEMVHEYDHLRFKFDDLNLKHWACSEIRANLLSGECRFTREFFTNGQWKLTRHFQDCIRRRAALSVSRIPQCKDDVQAVKVVNEVWDSCFADTRPFDEIYR